MKSKYIIVDLETTGNSPKRGDKIIQFAAVVIENGHITEKFSSLVNPQMPIPAFIEELTGLNDVQVQDAPVFSEIAPQVMNLLNGAYFVAHNVQFDLSFLQEELKQSGFSGFTGPLLDTVEMSRILNPTADSFKLSELAEHYGLMHDRPHQADSDAYVTAELFLILLKKIDFLPIKTLRQMTVLSTGLKCDFKYLLESMLAKRSEANEQFLPEIEFYKGLALKKPDCREGNTEPFGESFAFPAGALDKMNLFQKVPKKGLEDRPGQFSMMNGVYHAFQNQKHLVIEAGTGVGKSMGYLIPSLYLSQNEKKPIVVSTQTIQLQEQLLNREIPILKKMLPFHFSAAILKGRSHYLSLEKFKYSLIEETDNYDTTLTKMQILVWLTETTTGDRDELNLSSGGLLYWNKIKNDQNYFAHETDWVDRDFYLRAKSRAHSADLIITNHSLVMSDMLSRNKMLPSFDYLVIDEGHQFEKMAGKYLGASLDYLTVRLLLSQLGLMDQKQLLFKISELVLQMKLLNLFHFTEINENLSLLNYELEEFFRIALIYAKKKNSQGRNTMTRTAVRLSASENSNEWKALVNSGERVIFLIRDLHEGLKAVLNHIEQKLNEISYDQKMIFEELSLFLQELESFYSSLKMIVQDKSDSVKWMEVDFRSPQNSTTFFTQPANVSGRLRTELFDRKKSVIVTSATLTVKNRFDYLLNEMGINDGAADVMQVSSPFNYKKQVQLLIADDLPEVNSVPQDEYVASITEHIISIAEATKGRMLILFTAHEMLKKTYELMKESGFLDDFAILAQGITSGSRTRLTRNFQRYDKAILLGTSSFWEGVDIPGEDLTCLVIVRLPFGSPDEPLTEAKSNLVRERGGNPFSDYALPEAILRFKQGFGRLIRTEDDRGIVVVFDRRIISTKYGKAFLESIPEVPIVKGEIDMLLARIKSWL